MGKIPFSFDGTTLTLILNHSSMPIPKTHPNFKKIQGLLKQTKESGVEKKIIQLLNIKKDIKKKTGNKCVLKNGQIYWDGEVVHNEISRRIVEIHHAGFPYDGLLKFLENCKKNPSPRAEKEIFTFLEHKHIPITDDGCFLAYKAVTRNFLDKHTGTVSYKIGSTIKVERGSCADWGIGCGQGLHVGGLDYVFNFGNDTGDIILIVKINPKDVVSVPSLYEQKCRVCELTVVGEFKGELTEPVYATEVPIDEFEYGVKPSGQKFHNKRGASGRFVKK